MTKVRQDAWSHEDDLLLAETVLRHIRDGSTQLDAFEEVGDKLNRTGAACGFRWNAIVRKKYDQAVEIAKKQRKQKKRAEQGRKRQWEQPVPDVAPVSYEPSIPHQETQSTQEVYQASNHFEDYSTPNVTKQDESISLSEVITFLQTMEQKGMVNQRVASDNETLKQENATLRRQAEQMNMQIKKLQEKQRTIEEDYQSLIGIMDRARRMVVLQDEDSENSPSFKMDKNGNLEKVAK